MKKIIVAACAVFLAIGLVAGLAWKAWVGDDDALIRLLVEQPEWLNTEVPQVVDLGEGFEGSVFHARGERKRGAILLAPGLLAPPSKEGRLRVAGNALSAVGYTVLVPHSWHIGLKSEGVLLDCEAVYHRENSVKAGGRWLASQKDINPSGTFIGMSVSSGSHSLLKATTNQEFAQNLKGFFLLNPMDSVASSMAFAFSQSYQVEGKFTGELKEKGKMASFVAKAIALAIPAGHQDQIAIQEHLLSYVRSDKAGRKTATNFATAEGLGVYFLTAPPKGATIDQIVAGLPDRAKKAIDCWNVPASAYELGVPAIILSSPKDEYVAPSDSKALANKLKGKVYSSDMLEHTGVSKKAKTEVLRDGLTLLQAFKALNEIKQ